MSMLLMKGMVQSPFTWIRSWPFHFGCVHIALTMLWAGPHKNTHLLDPTLLKRMIWLTLGHNCERGINRFFVCFFFLTETASTFQISENDTWNRQEKVFLYLSNQAMQLQNKSILSTTMKNC